MRPTVFISYSHKDQRMLRTLSPYLESLQQHKLADIWNDTEIKGGERWREEIEDALNSATIAVLLISQEFLASKFICEEELPRIFRRQREGQITVLPVFLSPSAVTSTSISFLGSDGVERQVALSEFQGFGTPSRTLRELPVTQRDRIFLKLHDRIQELAASTSATYYLKPQAAVVSAPDRLPNRSVTLDPAPVMPVPASQLDLGIRVAPSVSSKVILDRQYAYTLTSYATDITQRSTSELLQAYDELFDVLTCAILLFDEIYVEQHHVSSLEFRLNDNESKAYSRLFIPFSVSEPVGTSSENLTIEFQIRQDLGDSELEPLITSYYGRKSVRPEVSKELVVYVNKILQWASVLGSSVFLRPKRAPLFEYKFRHHQSAIVNRDSQALQFRIQVPGRRYRSLDQLESLRFDPARELLKERTWQEIKGRIEGRMTDSGERAPQRSPEIIRVHDEIGFRADFYRTVRIQPSNLQGNISFFLVPESE